MFRHVNNVLQRVVPFKDLSTGLNVPMMVVGSFSFRVSCFLHRVYMC